MPRQIPLKRARGGGELDGCAEVYIKGIIAIIVLIFVGSFCRMAIDAISFFAPMIVIVIGIALVAIAFDNRSQIASWLGTIENQIDQWPKERFILVVAFLIALAFFLILLIAIFGITSLQNGQ